MYKSLTDLKKISLSTDLYRLHKADVGESNFGMDRSPQLLDDGFGLYSTAGTKRNIGPIKTEYFRIGLTVKGGAGFDVGLEKYRTQRNSILFSIPGQVFSLHDCSPDFTAYYMLFTEPFISDSLIGLRRKLQFPFLTYTGVQCFMLDDATAQDVQRLILLMNDEVKKNQAGCSEMIRLYIQQILVHANRNYGDILLSGYGAPGTLQQLYNSYLKLVSHHFLTVRKVSDYAAMLHVTPDHLNRAVKSCSDKTARELIDEMMLMEAKTYLLYSSMTIAEIAYKLDFSDPSHFHHFFRKLCRKTPLEFRRQS